MVEFFLWALLMIVLIVLGVTVLCIAVAAVHVATNRILERDRAEIRNLKYPIK